MRLKQEEAEIVNSLFFFSFFFEKETCLYKDCRSHILSFELFRSVGLGFLHGRAGVWFAPLGCPAP